MAVRFPLRGLKQQDWLVNVPLYVVNAFPGILERECSTYRVLACVMRCPARRAMMAERFW